METKTASAIYDISVRLDTGTPAWPGDPPFAVEPVASLDDGPFALTRLSMSAHAGAHIDFPSHVVKGGRAATDYAASRFVLPAAVVDVPEGRAAVTHEDVLGAGLSPGDAVLFRTGGARGPVRAAGLTPEAARACVGLEAALAGIDAPSVDRPGDDDLPVHRILLANDVLVLEGIDLSAVAPGRYTLICLPLPIAGGEASPVRAVLVGGAA